MAGIGEKTAATLINRYGDLATLRRALADGDPLLKGAQRARLEAASDYLDVAPLVVRVASDAPVEEHDATLPTTVADPVLLSGLAVAVRPDLADQPGARRARAGRLTAGPARRRAVPVPGSEPQSSRSAATTPRITASTALWAVAARAGCGAASAIWPSRSTICLHRRTKSPAAISLSLSTAVQPLAAGPAVHHPGHPAVRLAGERQRVGVLAVLQLAPEPDHLRVGVGHLVARHPRGDLPLVARGSWTSIDTAAASPAASSRRQMPWRRHSAASRSFSV